MQDAKDNPAPENDVCVPDGGFGDFDSRSGGELPLVEPRDGYRVVYCGTKYQQQLDGVRAEQVIRFEPMHG